MDFRSRRDLENEKAAQREASKEKDRRLREEENKRSREFQERQKEKDRQFREQQEAEKRNLIVQNSAMKEAMELSLLERKHELTPEQLNELYFDAVRHAKLRHAYEEKVRQLDHERKRELEHEKHERELEMVEHKVKWEVILQKSLMKLRQKYGGDSGLSEEDINTIIRRTMADGDSPPNIDL